MAKWSARIEKQAMDIGKHCPVLGKVHGTREIFDGFGNIFHGFGEARTVGQEEATSSIIFNQ